MRKLIIYIVIPFCRSQAYRGGGAAEPELSGALRAVADDRLDVVATDTASAFPADTAAVGFACGGATAVVGNRAACSGGIAGFGRVRYDKADLETAVDFKSSDSMVIVRRDSAYMYGEGEVSYGDIKLNAAEIQMDLSDNTVFAVGRTDSLGEVTGKPVFNDKGTDYEAATMRYNFATEGVI